MLLTFVINLTLLLKSGVILADSTSRSTSDKFEPTLSIRNRRQSPWQREYRCPPLEVIDKKVKCMLQNSEVNCAAPVPPGTTVTGTCYLNYKPENQRPVECLSNGWWSNPLPRCIPVCGYTKDVAANPLTVNGTRSRTGHFPWYAGIYHRQEIYGDVVWEQSCGGSLISDRYVLTAGHCVYGKVNEDVRIGLGKIYRSWNLEEYGQAKFNVSKMLYPPEFSMTNYAFDIALVLLDGKVTFGEQIMPVCLSFKGEPKNIKDKQLFIAGWGLTSGSPSEILLTKEVMTEPENKCKKMVPYFFPTFEKICLVGTSTSVSEAQPGDSGGGMTTLYEGLHYVFGIVSVRLQGNVILTNVAWPQHLAWIEDVLTTYGGVSRKKVGQIMGDSILNIARTAMKILSICNDEGGVAWSCKKLSECPPAQADPARGLNIRRCYARGNEPYVCCKPSTPWDAK